MSLEDKLAELIVSIDTLTSTIARAASAQRQPPETPAVRSAPVVRDDDPTPEAEAVEDTTAPKRGPGRPRKEPPPSPSQSASQGSKATPKPTPAEPPAPAAASTASSPATAPAAGSGSEAAPDVDALYDELKGLVTQHSGANGRSATMALFAEYDVAVPASLKTENVAKLPEVVARFRKELS